MPRQSSLLGSNQSLEDVLAEVAADIIQPRPEQTDSSTGLAERSLYEFLRQAWPTIEPSREFTPGWHLGCITEHLQAMESLEIRNLLINIPPRHCKSTIACVCLFAWAWIRNPSSQWIYCCYGEKLAERDSNRCRDLVQSQWYQARWGHVFRLKHSQNTAERFANDRRGYRIATTVSGKAMGEGGDWLCLPPDEIVWTEQGRLPIGQIVEKRLALRVLAYDTCSGKVGWKPITGWHRNPGSRIVEVVLSDGARVCCTPDHLFWTVNRGWVRADRLLASDSLPRPAMLDKVNQLAADAIAVSDSLKCAVSSQNFADLTSAHLVSASLPSGARDWQGAGSFAPVLAGANHVDGVRRDAVAGVRHAGYSTKTYCLTVADYHTMIIGTCQTGIVVKNCFDDPNKPTDMRSEAHRAQVIESWTKTMSTRGNDPKTVRKLVIQQRLGERDLTGYLVAERGGYEHLVLPAEYEPRRYFFPQAQSIGQGNVRQHEGQSPVDTKPRDAIVPTILQRTNSHLLDGPTGSGRREEGDLLWPERFGPAEIESLKADLEGVGWAGQGQQRPAPATGSIFRGEMFRRFTLEPGPLGLMAVLGVSGDEDNESTTEPLRLSVQDMRFYQCADTAMTAKAESAYTVIATFAWHRPTRNLLVWHVFRQRLRVHEQLPVIRELRHGQGLWDAAGRRWLIPGKLAPWPRPLAFQAVEDRASGHGILDEARASGYPLRALKTGNQDKVMRAAVAATMYGAGKVWHRAEVNWRPDLEDEMLVFPSGAYLDQVDTIAYACRLADEDSLLNAAIEGPLLMPSPLNEDGLPATPDDLRRPQGQEVFHVGGTRVVFEDENFSDGWTR